MAGTTAQRIAVIPGDGIGHDVIEIARAVLDAAGTQHGFTLDYQLYDWSCQRYVATGAMMPDDAVDILRARCHFARCGWLARGA